ncbi:lytic transglycosylase domain-containing protein [Nocardioides sp. AX2bis]|uniref:lytic transglycosylase domain-containing protein n=1 Tax=Nocardioides sp. AX2bis TaxID=2653157 RepID=UPI0012F13A85|nr:lytic transglycosylase domain-containing protein [Nocardioides sp. AX2bis]VXC20951.1 Transglycosylase SLT domain-containing protein [Nocardioides sp. AX2bis]
MSDPRRRRLQRATAILPLALLSAAVTASLASPQAALTTVDGQQALPKPGSLPDGSTLPEQAIEAPASLSSPSRSGGLGLGGREAAVQNASTNDIPSAALAAYQRAATVVNAADESCSIPWQLIAAVGRVESDHGRYGGNVLDDEGLATPGIYGVPLTGSNGTARITDTDAGQFDDDQRFDRAVGPMQFIPSTWAVVGVDADGDGERNPQDIDDAALATGVYLCSGPDDLSERPGQRAAVFRYNNSNSYVDLVISVMESYLGGDFTSVPTGTTASEPIAPAPAPPVPPTQRQFQPVAPSTPSGGGSSSTPPEASTGGSTTDGGGSTTTPPDSGDGGSTPVTPPATGGGGTGGGGLGDLGGAVDDALGTGGGGGGGSTGGGGGGGGAGPVEETLTKAEATAQCLASGIGALEVAKLAACVEDLVNP